MNLIILVPVVVLLICFLLRVPIAYSMLTAAIAYLLIVGQDLGLIADSVMGSLYANTTLIAAPLFIFTANIMTSSKVSDYMYTFVKSLFGGKRGATAYMNVIVSLIFAGMSGSAVADAAGQGLMEIREMDKDGYDRPFSCAITAATAVIGPIFPPSIQMVIFAMLSGASVGKLFLGGVAPAIVMVLGFFVYIYYISKKRQYPRSQKYTLKEFLSFTWKAFPALLTPVILLGGIYSGVVTATESGVLAGLYAIIIAAFAYRVLGLKDLIGAIKATIIQSGIVMACLASAFALNFVIVQSGLGAIVTKLVLNFTNSKIVFMLLVNLIFIICGMFLPTEISTFVVTPLLLPIVTALGINMVYFGVVTSINIILGNVTPPFGFLCFVVSGITETPLQAIFKEIMPMIIMLFICLLLFILVPGFTTFIPSLMG